MIAIIQVRGEARVLGQITMQLRPLDGLKTAFFSNLRELPLVVLTIIVV